MSVNPNQSWVTPNDSLFGGSSQLNPAVQTITAAYNPTNAINMNDNNNNIKMAVGTSSFVVSYNSEADTRLVIQPTNGVSIGFYGTTTGGIALQENNTPANWGIAQTLMSSMTGTSLGGGGVLDLNGLISTLKVVYPPIVK